MPKWLRVVHALILVNFIGEICYGFYMVFYAVGGTRWPLFGRAEDIPVQVILKRRLYAVETWLAIGALAIYVAVTEILPRRLNGTWPQRFASDPGAKDGSTFESSRNEDV